MAITSWFSGWLGTGQTVSAQGQLQGYVTTTTTTTQSANTQFGLQSGITAMQLGNYAKWKYPEVLDESHVKMLKRLLALKDYTDEELVGCAESIAKSMGCDVDTAKAALGVIKTLLVLGELEAKLDEKTEEQEEVDSTQINLPIQWTTASTISP